MQDFGTKADNSPPPGGQLSAAEFNNLATENENAVVHSGQTLSGASDTQLAQSLFLHGVKSQTFQDSGAANAYVATPVSGAGGVLLPGSYATMNGAIISFSASAANTGASTLNIGQTTGTLIGTKKIFTESGADLTAGSIQAGQYLQLRYAASLDSGAGAWILLRWSASEFANHGNVVFAAAGVTPWVIPAGVFRVRVTVIGGGGGGGKRTGSASSGAGGGGGGGGVSEGFVTVTPGASINVTVGAGGAGATVANTAGTNGGASSFGIAVTATGGNGGGITGGGNGGVGSGGDLNTSLGPGSGGISFSNSAAADNGITGAGGGPGGAGITFASGSGSINGNAAIGPGGGGGGAVFAGNGGAGFNGIVLIRW